MFRISFMVEDQHLIEVMRKVASFAINLNVSDNNSGVKLMPKTVSMPLPEPLPVLKEKTKGLQSLDRIMDTLKERNLKSFRASMFREILKSAGLNPTSYGYYLNELVKYGCLTKHGNGTQLTYMVAAARST